MNYPIWRLGFPGGILIAIIAVVHVFVSHFAVGGGAYLVLTERRAYRSGDEQLLAYVRRYSKFFALLTVVFGAVTGVGIWFAIGLVSPEATSSLIHSFVWGWAIEWVFFFVEIAAALIYAYNWDTLDRDTHLVIGWIYFVAAWASLAIINGIITYMLTPGHWLETKAFWDGFFNPTYWPSLFMRTFFTIALAGVWGLVTAGKLQSPTRERASRWAGSWMVLGLALLPFTAWWYYGKFPAFAHDYVAGLIPVAEHVVRFGIVCTAIAASLALLFGILKPGWRSPAVMAVMVLACFGALASGEYLREFVRKPYAVNGYIYANGIRVTDVSAIAANGGMAANDKWMVVSPGPTVEYGHEVFIAQCSACHSVSGYRGIRSRIKGWDEKYAAAVVPHLSLTRGTMPEFGGDQNDAAALGKYLGTLVPEPLPSTGSEMEIGQKVFQERCALCHTIKGARRPLDFGGADFDTVDGMLQQLDSLTPEMPPFTGTEAQRHALANWLRAQN